MLTIFNTLAQISSDFNSSYQTSSTSTASAAAFGVVMLIIWLLVILLAVVPAIVVSWKLFTKAGKPGWASIVPIYNLVVMCEIAQVPTWYAVLALLPGINIVGIILIYVGLAKQYSNQATVWLSWLVPIIALFMVGKTEYIGGNAQPQAPQTIVTPGVPQDPTPPQPPINPMG